MDAQLLVGLEELLIPRLSASMPIHLFAPLPLWKLMQWLFPYHPILLAQFVSLPYIKFYKIYFMHITFSDLA